MRSLLDREPRDPHIKELITEDQIDAKFGSPFGMPASFCKFHWDNARRPPRARVLRLQQLCYYIRTTTTPAVDPDGISVHLSVVNNLRMFLSL